MNRIAQGEPIRPFYWADWSAVTLYSGRLELRFDSDVGVLDGEVAMDWLPSPRLIWRGATSESSSVLLGLRQMMTAVRREPEVRLLDLAGLPSRKPKRVTLGERPSYSDGGVLRPLVYSNGRRIHSVVCNIINGPFLGGVGLAALTKDASVWPGRLDLASPRWLVTMDQRPDDRAIRDQLRDTGGFAFTHVVKVSRADSRPFIGEDEVWECLRALTDMLSFARGDRVGVALPTGLDSAGRRCWVAWSPGVPAAWRGRLSWFDGSRPDDLRQLYHEFVVLGEDRFWREVISRSIHYYVRANDPDPVDLASVNTQSAFELLAWSVLKEKTKLLSRSQFKKLDAAGKLRILLQVAGIDTTIPASLTDLASAAQKHHWTDGPHAITEMRNTMVHPTLRRPRFQLNCWIDSWRLGQAYLEFLLLRLMNYRGRHMSRMPDASRWAGSSLPMPWP